MSERGTGTWEFVPHQHRGPQQQTGADDHIYSPKLHNGTLKSSGIVTFMQPVQMNIERSHRESRSHSPILSAHDFNYHCDFETDASDRRA